MFTLLFIFIIVFALIASNSKDSKSKKKLAENSRIISTLPDISFRAKEMTSMQKALNLWPNDNDILQEFKYFKENKTIYLKMKDGRYVNCPLSLLDVTFDKVNALYRFVIRNNDVKFSFYQWDYTFTKKEWDVIINTLTLAGTTRNVAIMGTSYKNLQKANTVLKIIKALS